MLGGPLYQFYRSMHLVGDEELDLVVRRQVFNQVIADMRMVPSSPVTALHVLVITLLPVTPLVLTMLRPRAGESSWKWGVLRSEWP